jgi:choline-sulfatase
MGVIRWASLVIAVVVSALVTTPAETPDSHPKAPASAHSSASQAPNIVLVTLDTTRADRMDFLGSERHLTPNLDGLAKHSGVFTHAYSQVPLTTPSHATILSGTYPQYHQVNDLHTPLVDDVPSGPETLRSRGYHTGAFVGSIILNPVSPYAQGFDRGFDTYDAGFENAGPGEDRYKTVQRRGAEVVTHAFTWLDKQRKGPFFVWVHMYDAHDPYDPPQPYKSRYKSEPYDGCIAYEDAAVGKIIQGLKLRGLYDNTVIVVTADHGESLGAHGEDTHGVFLYDETIHVPLLIKLPKNAGARRIDSEVELADIMPTLLQETGIAIPAEVQGESLLPLMGTDEAASAAAAATWQHRSVYSQSVYPHADYGWSSLRSWRTEKYLYVQAPRRELYDKRTDPTAEHNLAPASPAIADTLAAQMESFRQETKSQHKAPQNALNLADQEKLGALGYMASSPGIAKSDSEDEGADPKDRIEIANMIHHAELLQQDMHAKESINLLAEVISREPGLHLYATLAQWMMRADDYKAAVPVLRKAIALEPDLATLHLELAMALAQSGDLEAATPEAEAIEAKMPQLVNVHLLLQMIYTQTNRTQDAIRESKFVLAFVPDHYPSYLILGRLLEISGDNEGAISSLNKASALEPTAPDPHVVLAEIYDQIGRKAEAARERATATRLGKNSKTPPTGGNSDGNEKH